MADAFSVGQCFNRGHIDRLMIKRVAVVGADMGHHRRYLFIVQLALNPGMPLPCATIKTG